MLKAVTALLFAITPITPAQTRGIASTVVDQLARAAYFAPICSLQAATIAVPPSPTATAVIAAFAARADAPQPSECAEPSVLLTNLLRRHGFDAELVFVAGLAPTDRDAVAVYVPEIDRYVDPKAPSKAEHAFDRSIRSQRRYHLAGPTLAATGLFRCASTCLGVYGPDRPDLKRVKPVRIPATEVR